ncbi:MAG: DUF2271 domain-containing protein [Brevundimonas sp.]
MRVLPLAIAAAGAAASPALAADLNVSVEIPRIATASYHRPYVAVWIERADRTSAGTLAVWYDTALPAGEGKDWLKDMRTWWRREGRAMTLPADGVSSATRAPGRHSVTFSGTRGPLRNLPAGQYTLVVEAARELGGREEVRVPFRWGASSPAATQSGSSELGAVTVSVTR